MLPWSCEITELKYTEQLDKIALKSSKNLPLNEGPSPWVANIFVELSLPDTDPIYSQKKTSIKTARFLYMNFANLRTGVRVYVLAIPREVLHLGTSNEKAFLCGCSYRCTDFSDQQLGVISGALTSPLLRGHSLRKQWGRGGRGGGRRAEFEHKVKSGFVF